MRAPTSRELLDAWERGLDLSPVRRPFALLEAASPEIAPETLERLSPGQRDDRLLTLREWTFGTRLVGLADCPKCGERSELDFETADIRAGQQPTAPSTYHHQAGEYDLEFRLPDAQDLAGLEGSGDVSEGKRRLLERCILSVHNRGEVSSVDRLPQEALEAVVRRMAEADPQADVRLSLACPSCGSQWEAAFDIAAFFWDELDAWAKRLLREVHVLASAYGWSESEVLSLSTRRRQLYLEMALG